MREIANGGDNSGEHEAFLIEKVIVICSSRQPSQQPALRAKTRQVPVPGVESAVKGKTVREVEDLTDRVDHAIIAAGDPRRTARARRVGGFGRRLHRARRSILLRYTCHECAHLLVGHGSACRGRRTAMREAAGFVWRPRK